MTALPDATPTATTAEVRQMAALSVRQVTLHAWTAASIRSRDAEFRDEHRHALQALALRIERAANNADPMMHAVLERTSRRGSVNPARAATILRAQAEGDPDGASGAYDLCRVLHRAATQVEAPGSRPCRVVE